MFLPKPRINGVPSVVASKYAPTVAAAVAAAGGGCRPIDPNDAGWEAQLTKPKSEQAECTAKSPRIQKQEKKDPTIQPPAKLKPPQTTAPTAILDYHGCKKSKIALGAVAGRGSGQSGSATSGFVAHAITI